jgi:anti-sigma-K factor RskA
VEHVDELIAGHALRALSSEDEERVVVHLAECERCRRRLRETEAVAASLAYSVPQAAPPPELRSRVLAIAEPVVAASASEGPAPEAPAPEPRPVRTPPPRSRRSWWPRFSLVAVPAMALALAGMIAWNVSLRHDLDSNRNDLASGAAVTLPGVGNVVAQTDGNATLFAHLSPAPAGKTYEAWVIRGSAALPAGVFEGGGTVELKLTEAAKPGDKIAVTVEPSGGSQKPTTTPIAVSQNV